MAWRFICDRCGFEYWNHQGRKEWTGLIVCNGPGTNNCWEPRHPQDFVRGVKDKQTPPWTRPEGTDTFTDLVDTANTASAWAAFGTNTVADNSEQGITVTYSDQINGAYVDLNASGGLSSNLTVGQTYIVSFQAQLSGPSCSLQAYDGSQPDLVDIANTVSAWVPGGSNTVEQDGDAVKITYVDNAVGANLFLNESGGLSADTVVGGYYEVRFSTKVNAGSSVQWLSNDGLLNFEDLGTITSTDYVVRQGIFDANSTDGCRLRHFDFGAGEIVWVKDISFRYLPNYPSEFTSATLAPGSDFYPGSITFTAQSETECRLQFSGMTAGDVAKLRYISVRAV